MGLGWAGLRRGWRAEAGLGGWPGLGGSWLSWAGIGLGCTLSRHTISMYPVLWF